MSLIVKIQALRKQGLKYRDIAEQLGVTNQQIASAIHDSGMDYKTDINELFAKNYSNREISIITRKAVSTVQMLRRDSGDMRTAGDITRDKILEAYADCGDIDETCAITGFTYKTVTKHLL